MVSMCADRARLTGRIAIVRFPPCWRERKPRLGEDHGALGRNQLVADILERVTGHKRTRKQISSHLQVLKGYVGVDQFCE